VKAHKKAIFTAASEASEAAAFLAARVFRVKVKRGSAWSTITSEPT
jgi:hypothetical protein